MKVDRVNAASATPLARLARAVSLAWGDARACARREKTQRIRYASLIGLSPVLISASVAFVQSSSHST